MKLNRIFPLILILVMAMPAVVSADLAASDFTDYPYGIQRYSADATAYRNELNNKYAQWKASYVTTSGANGYRRVVSPEAINGYANCTVSEGIGYGMLLAAYFNDQALFNDLWAYKEWRNDGNQLMNWLIDSSGTVRGNNSATDADTDIAFALLKANERWGGYGALATAEINKIMTNCVAGDRSLKPGDMFDDYEYPSYYAPAFYRQFGTHVSQVTFWNDVINMCNTHLQTGRNASYGIADETLNNNGSRRYDNYKYNSCRIPWRYAIDYVWYGTTFSGNQINMMAGFFNGKGLTNIVDGYDVGNGNAIGSIHNAAFVGPAGCSMMYSSTYNTQLTSTDPNVGYYQHTMNFSIPSTYYNASLQMLSLLLMSGYMPANIGSAGTPTNTPTPGGPTATFTNTPSGGNPALLDDMEDNNNANNWSGYWYTYDDLNDGGSSYVVPWSAQRCTLAGIPEQEFKMSAVTDRPGSSYAARMTGYVTTQNQYGFVGMGTGFLEPKSPVDLSGCTGIRFWEKGDGKQYRVKIQSNSPAHLLGAADNFYGYAFMSHTSWFQQDILFSMLTQEPYWGTSVAKATSLAMATDLQFQTVGQPHTSIDLWIDDIEIYGCASYPTPPAGDTPTNTPIVPTNTFTNTPTPGGPTPTDTPSGYNPALLDDMEDNNNANNWSGYWYTYD
ncbi:MAG TPA: CIA30 family protein, partial [Candidatus Goldiibacteriota bacterium]|nr:CIA30 family protein [Candidatus Goldiibacteriota bacterium]